MSDKENELMKGDRPWEGGKFTAREVASSLSSSTGSTLDGIPRQHLIAMLKAAAWYSGGRESYGDRQGYSYDVQEETSLRDVIYRDESLYKTPEEAIVGHWLRHYSSND